MPSELYLLDSNVVIDANRDYYPIDRIPQFWAWLEGHARAGRIKLPVEVYEEVIDGNDTLADWAKRLKDSLSFSETVPRSAVQRVIATGYAPDLNDVELVAVGRDPLVIAHCLAAPESRCIVTTERSKPSKKRHNRHVPDVCAANGIRCIHTYQLIVELDFRLT